MVGHETTQVELEVAVGRTWIWRWISRPLVAAALALPACTLALPKVTAGDGSGGPQMCTDQSDGGAAPASGGGGDDASAEVTAAPAA